MRQISFISANYVARALNYSGLADWGAHDRATVAAASAENFQSMAQDIANAGFKAVDVWVAHCDWRHHQGDGYAARVKEICQQQGLEITSYAGGLQVQKPTDLDGPFTMMQQLGAPIFAGGIGGLPSAELAPMVEDACQKYGVRWGLENHPEKTTDEILQKIGQGKYPNCGVALDTGWCGTQGMDALEATKRLREHLFILHLKDITEPGGHDTCALGDGVVPVEQVVRYLVETDWQGTICIEHEPYDRDPMPEVQTSLQRVQQWLQ